MKLVLIVFSAFLLLNFQKKPGNISVTHKQLFKLSPTGDSSKLRFANSSSLKHLPSVIRDLSMALGESIFQEEGLLNENGFTVNLQDVFCKNFDTSATVTYRPADTVYYLKLNRLNKYATDRALAVTLIHETMHCVLMDIDRRARHGDEKALYLIERFNQKIKNPFVRSVNNFFDLMNQGDVGQHELMCQLFYDDMVLLLERFAQIHRPSFAQHEDAEILIWSGLQSTNRFNGLSLEEKRQIELTILREKGVAVSNWNY